MDKNDKGVNVDDVIERKKPGPKPGFKRRPKEPIVVTYVEPTKVKVECPPAVEPFVNLQIRIPEDLMTKLVSETADLGFDVSLNDILVAALDNYLVMTRNQRAVALVRRDDIFQNIICPYMERRDVSLVVKLSMLKEMGSLS